MDDGDGVLSHHNACKYLQRFENQNLLFMV